MKNLCPRALISIPTPGKSCEAMSLQIIDDIGDMYNS